jgi:hypothetical protein
MIANTSDQPDPLFVNAFENGDYGIAIACLLGMPVVQTELDMEGDRAATHT